VTPLPTIEAEWFQMRQLFQNLISNSLKYHKENTPPVVKVQHKSSSEGVEEIWIEDNGKGFDEKHRDRIFRPFERLHGISEYDGTGIGLAICQKIVGYHKGHITATSQLGQGATFKVKLLTRQEAE
jgi:signal transduction histidine kinase